jgi:hypothetical protein
LEYPFAIPCPCILSQDTPNLICESKGILRDVPIHINWKPL